ncbi:unnamed protein product, partial [Brachionus calyciflorus]
TENIKIEDRNSVTDMSMDEKPNESNNKSGNKQKIKPNSFQDGCYSSSFTKELSLNQQIDNKHCKFRLYAVVVHSGNCDFGHYFSFIRARKDCWYKFDDLSVEECNISDVIEIGSAGIENSSAYILI